MEAVEFLARSENRVRALAELTAGPCDRDALVETVGVSRVTAQRILDEFVRRGWATATDRTYRATEPGAIISEAVESLLDVVAVTDRLTAVVSWLPPEFDVDLRRLTDADVTLPTHGDPIAPVRRSTVMMSEASSIRGLGAGVAPDVLRVNRDSVVDDGQSFEAVFSEGVLDVVRADPRLSRWLREMLEGGATVYRHPDVSLLLGEFDNEVVFLGLADESGVPRGAIESRDVAMKRWFETTFERYQSSADRVDIGLFTP